MSEDFIQVAPDTPGGKKLRSLAQTISGDTRESEVIVLATGAANGGDTYDARQIRVLTAADIVTANQGTAQGLANAAWPVNLVVNASGGAPTFLKTYNSTVASNVEALPVRNIVQGTQTIAGNVGITGTPTVNQGGPPWWTQVGDSFNKAGVAQLSTPPGSAIYGLITDTQLIGIDASTSIVSNVSTMASSFGEGLVVVPGGYSDGSAGNLTGVGSAVTGIANASRGTLVEGNYYLLSLDLNGNLRTRIMGPLDSSGNVQTSIQNTPNVNIADPTTSSQKAAVNNQGQQAVNIVLTPWQPPALPVGGFGASSWKGSW